MPDLRDQRRDGEVSKGPERSAKAVEQSAETQDVVIERQRRADEAAIEAHQAQLEAIQRAAKEQAAALAKQERRRRRAASHAWRLQADSKVKRAGELRHAGMTEEAARLCREAISVDPGNLWGYCLLVYCLADRCSWSREELANNNESLRNEMQAIFDKAVRLLRIPEYGTDPYSYIRLAPFVTDLASASVREILRNALRENVGQIIDPEGPYGWKPGWMNTSAQEAAVELTAALVRGGLLPEAEVLTKAFFALPDATNTWGVLDICAWETERCRRAGEATDVSFVAGLLAKVSPGMREHLAEAVARIEGSDLSDTTKDLILSAARARLKEWESASQATAATATTTTPTSGGCFIAAAACAEVVKSNETVGIGYL